MENINDLLESSWWVRVGSCSLVLFALFCGSSAGVLVAAFGMTLLTNRSREFFYERVTGKIPEKLAHGLFLIAIFVSICFVILGLNASLERVNRFESIVDANKALEVKVKRLEAESAARSSVKHGPGSKTEAASAVVAAMPPLAKPPAVPVSTKEEDAAMSAESAPTIEVESAPAVEVDPAQHYQVTDAKVAQKAVDTVSKCFSQKKGCRLQIYGIASDNPRCFVSIKPSTYRSFSVDDRVMISTISDFYFVSSDGLAEMTGIPQDAPYYPVARQHLSLVQNCEVWVTEDWLKTTQLYQTGNMGGQLVQTFPPKF